MNVEHDLAADIREIDGRHDMGTAELAEKLVERGWSKLKAIDEGELGTLAVGSVVRNVESGAVVVRESDKDWFITGLDYELELWELYNHEGREWMVLFTPDGA